MHASRRFRMVKINDGRGASLFTENSTFLFTEIDTLLFTEYREQQFESFRLRDLLGAARIKHDMTQKEPAEKRETNKSYVSRIENNSTKIQFCDINKNYSAGTGKLLKINSSTLMK